MTEFTTLKENMGPFNSAYFSTQEMVAAARHVANKDASDPFAYSRAISLMQRGVYRPSDIKAGISV